MPDTNSPYAERPEGSRESGLVFAQTFGTVRKVLIPDINLSLNFSFR
jgi:hypothetical protein